MAIPRFVIGFFRDIGCFIEYYARFCHNCMNYPSVVRALLQITNKQSLPMQCLIMPLFFLQLNTPATILSLAQSLLHRLTCLLAPVDPTFAFSAVPCALRPQKQR